MIDLSHIPTPEDIPDKTTDEGLGLAQMSPIANYKIFWYF
jgi:hypothetical protein